MKNSRLNGVLVVNIDNPYTLANNGQIEQHNRVVCLDVNSKTEMAAIDLEQLIVVAMVTMAENRKVKQKQIDGHGSESDTDFYDNESPQEEEITDRAEMLEMLIKSGTKVQLSAMVEIFERFVHCGAIKMSNEQKMPIVKWKDEIKITDKIKIMMSYIVFFVNPLQKLELQSRRMEKKNLQGQQPGKETL